MFPVWVSLIATGLLVCAFTPEIAAKVIADRINNFSFF